MFVTLFLISIAHGAVGKSFDYQVGGRNISYVRSEKVVSLSGDGVNENYKIAFCEYPAFETLEAKVYTLATKLKESKNSPRTIDKSQVIEVNVAGLGSLRTLKTEPLGELLIGLQTELFKTKMIGERLCKK